MNAEVRKKMLEAPWEPKTYNAQELIDLLSVSTPQACQIIADITASIETVTLRVPWVTHHDLMAYLIDTVTISKIPEHEEELPRQGLWLIAQGWSIDAGRQNYRWIDPDIPNQRLTLRDALKRQLERERPLPSVRRAPIQHENVTEAEFTIRPKTTSGQ